MILYSWQERLALQSVAIWGSTKNDDSGPLLSSLSSNSFSIFYSTSRVFLIEWLLKSKNLFSESCSERPITWRLAPSAVRHCRWCGVAGDEQGDTFLVVVLLLCCIVVIVLMLLYFGNILFQFYFVVVCVSLFCVIQAKD